LKRFMHGFDGMARKQIILILALRIVQFRRYFKSRPNLAIQRLNMPLSVTRLLFNQS
jgi:hypothetical protein